MIGKSLLVLLWFPLTFVLLLVNLVLLGASSKASASISEQYPRPLAHRVTASAGTAQILGASVVAGDARGLLLKRFLEKYGSPMAPYADLIVQQADANSIDFRLTVAIAMCESNLGKHIPSHDSFNPFGVAVFTGTQSGKKFESWEHAISWVSTYLRTNFYDRGITNLRDIGAIYAPPSVANGYSWTTCVEQFMGQIL
ncbi:glucosaminidase domain-containing protein [Candidatus Gottesmanbacteria bacterium]|nr:glucosaminidase domain-containing protein [Candidatus Gottesmanbacteria bacterium]